MQKLKCFTLGLHQLVFVFFDLHDMNSQLYDSDIFNLVCLKLFMKLSLI